MIGHTYFMVNKTLQPIIQILGPRNETAKNLIMLDRDGTINRDFGYTYKLSDLFILEKNLEIIKNYVNNESTVLCISNQSGIGRGYFTDRQATTFNKALSQELKKFRVVLEVFYICPHTPESKCLCRKPGTLMIEMALNYSGIPLSKSVFIGDSQSDLEACHKLGLKFIQVSKNNI